MGRTALSHYASYLPASTASSDLQGGLADEHLFDGLPPLDVESGDQDCIKISLEFCHDSLSITKELLVGSFLSNSYRAGEFLSKLENSW